MASGDISDFELRSRLLKFISSVPPVTATTRRLLLQRLQEYEKSQTHVNGHSNGNTSNGVSDDEPKLSGKPLLNESVVNVPIEPNGFATSSPLTSVQPQVAVKLLQSEESVEDVPVGWHQAHNATPFVNMQDIYGPESPSTSAASFSDAVEFVKDGEVRKRHVFVLPAIEKPSDLPNLARKPLHPGMPGPYGEFRLEYDYPAHLMSPAKTPLKPSRKSRSYEYSGRTSNKPSKETKRQVILQSGMGDFFTPVNVLLLVLIGVMVVFVYTMVFVNRKNDVL